jgi:hypothetical protein
MLTAEPPPAAADAEALGAVEAGAWEVATLGAAALAATDAPADAVPDPPQAASSTADSSSPRARANVGTGLAGMGVTS